MDSYLFKPSTNNQSYDNEHLSIQNTITTLWETKAFVDSVFSFQISTHHHCLLPSVGRNEALCSERTEGVQLKPGTVPPYG